MLICHTILRGLNPELMSRVVYGVSQASLNMVIDLINGAYLVHRGIYCLLVVPLFSSENSLSLTVVGALRGSRLLVLLIPVPIHRQVDIGHEAFLTSP